jgi:hypothetical protein
MINFKCRTVEWDFLAGYIHDLTIAGPCALGRRVKETLGDSATKTASNNKQPVKMEATAAKKAP